ncbi:hypothetical protein ACIRSJ_20315 [Streptomyces virginiae]|uniref:hypothetical protein n=1 Tax=Streptomyces virginiae TaxID=1961 RepID=UPI003818A321
MTTVFTQQPEELLDRSGAVRGRPFDLRGPTQGGGNGVLIAQPLGEAAVGPEVEGFADGVHAERGLVADEDGLQMLE